MSRILMLLLFACAGLYGQSPIVLGSANMPGKNDTLRYTDIDPASIGNYLAAGTNYYWDFSKVSSAGQGLRSFKSAAQTPYFFFFAGANEYGEKVADTLGAGPLVITNVYNYYRYQNFPVSAFVADGVGLTFSSVPVPSYYTDKDELYIFPLTFGKRDSTTFKFSTPNTSMLPLVYTKEGYRITEVDGWGVVATPYGVEQCLRLVSTQYATDEIKTSFLPFPLRFPNYQRSYQWLTLNAKIPFLEISGTLNGANFNTATARYRGYARKVRVGLEEHDSIQPGLFPNPVGDRLFLSGSAGMQFAIFSIQGELVREGTVKPDTTIETEGLAPGVYFIKCGGAVETMHRFVKL